MRNRMREMGRALAIMLAAIMLTGAAAEGQGFVMEKEELWQEKSVCWWWTIPSWRARY